MESSSHEIVIYDQYRSSLQVSSESNLLSQKLYEFQAEEIYYSISEDETSVSEFEEEDDIANKEDYIKIEEVCTLESNKENEKKGELCIGMEFSSDEMAHEAYKKFEGQNGFDVRKEGRKKKNGGNIFWADDRSISDYNLSGDVVCFDITYKTNEYNRPFAPFVGVNHHKQIVVFGAALVYDETTDSYKWLFKTFLGAMSEKQPKTILTDQSAAMANAIMKFATNFGKCLYDHEEEEDWLLAWNNMLNKHNLTENKWLKNVFEVREKWAMVYGRHTFTIDMMSTQHSESMNNILKRYLKRSYDLLTFFEHYERGLDDRRYSELTVDFKMMHTSSVLSATVEMLRHTEEVYTPKVYRLFQKQYTIISDYVAKKVSKSEMMYEYKVSYFDGPREHLVKYDASNQAIQCMLDTKDVRRIPSSYILTRWCKEAKSRSISSYPLKTPNGTVTQSIGKRYSHLCHNYHEITYVDVEHEELTMCANEAACELPKKLEEKKKELVKANAWMLPTSNVEHVKGEEEYEEVPNARGIKRKAHVGRPKNKTVGPYGRYLNVLETKKLHVVFWKEKKILLKGSPNSLGHKARESLTAATAMDLHHRTLISSAASLHRTCSPSRNPLCCCLSAD
ncbi:hypothetical protein AALP_AA4G094500 [Arabis alpina]|uniref:Protein FAR1-RELATED SEQUENCE n=1 Tax=Arabis alpina TaxID=50452 RepID=A0A087H275_ARAAL|nr:hypothetical protein AALP_AA4G094500 [Arabis alpina]